MALLFKMEIFMDLNSIIVTTGDLKDDYEIIGPVYFQISNKGLFSSALSSYEKNTTTRLGK